MIGEDRVVGELLARVRSLNPVVHSITNFVVMNSTANVLLAMGAAPLMAHATEELEEIVSISNAVVINIGTLSKAWVESMVAAAQLAKAKRKPLVLDPVGAGATKFRTHTARQIVDRHAPTVVRGNASEILSLHGAEAMTRGVDSAHSLDDAVNAARSLAESTRSVVAVTGERDFVTDGRKSYMVSNGHFMMGRVTGTGCAATVTIGAFLSAERDALLATAAALAFFGLAGERAAERAHGPGTFWPHLLDALYNLSPDDLTHKARIERI